ncbi:MAG: spore photoproduct lyase family protein [Candidatus Omnitrophota bacterium]
MLNIDDLKNFVAREFSGLGVNKQREIVRLLFEIAKREHIDFRVILQDVPGRLRHFVPLRNYLIKRRFPGLTCAQRRSNFAFSQVESDSRAEARTGGQFVFRPQALFVEQAVADTELVRRLRSRYPEAPVTEIASLRDYPSSSPESLLQYNERAKHLFLIKERFDFYSRCPCSPQTVSCHYHIINLGVGCPFECVYCCLQGYMNAPGLVIPANIGDFFAHFPGWKNNIRLGSGELIDSLALDHLTGYSPLIIDFFRQHPKCVFEFKTKSDNIELLLSVPPAENIVVSWSMNPRNIIEQVEFYTASLDRRLAAAEKCLAAGFKVGFHFDPVIYYDGWERDYQDLVNQLFDRIDARRIAWISLGALRMTQKVKKIIEQRFPAHPLLDGELFPGYDKKLRYSFSVRRDIYQKMIRWINGRSASVPVYLCMEEGPVWRGCGGRLSPAHSF